MKEDVIVAEVRLVREKLLKQYGGLDGYVEHLQEMDALRITKDGKQPVKKSLKPRRAKPQSIRSKKAKDD